MGGIEPVVLKNPYEQRFWWRCKLPSEEKRFPLGEVSADSEVG
jgi:hypothetical protein